MRVEEFASGRGEASGRSHAEGSAHDREDLEAQCQAQKQEIDHLKHLLEERDAELARLKEGKAANEGAASAPSAAPPAATAAPAAAKPSTAAAAPSATEVEPTGETTRQTYVGKSDGGKGVSSANGQVAQARYTDYEALLDSAFAAVREITSCCTELTKLGYGKDEVQLVLEHGQATLYPLEQIRLIFRGSELDEKDEAGHGKSKRTTVSLQHLTRSLQDTAAATRKYRELKLPIFGRGKVHAQAAAEFQKQAGAIKAYAISLLLEHGMKPTDFDRSKKAAANLYHLQHPGA